MEGRPPEISVQGLSYEIDGKALLSQVDLSVDQGQFVGVIGPNGAGKSTLLKAISGGLRYRSGSVRLEDSDLDALSPRQIAAGLALIPQIAPYTSGFTAMELVLMGRYPHLGRFEIEGQGRTSA